LKRARRAFVEQQPSYNEVAPRLSDQQPDRASDRYAVAAGELFG
jgi:hypothetical protein